MINLKKALSDQLYKNHKIGYLYSMNDSPDLWELVYYPIFQDGKTQEYYKEPRALMRNVNKKGFWHKEVPLRYLTLK